MCGIAGIISFSEKNDRLKQQIEAATHQLRKRGPDHRNTFLHGRVALGHTRLSVIDTSALANQPFTSADGRYTIVFNGEIYNHATLRDALEKEGHRFRSKSDTEVLLQLFIHEGKTCLQKLNGFFAFAIYDQTNDEVFLARDRMGIKPLLYYQDEHRLAFASEMKALMAMDIPRQIDHTSLWQFLQFNYIPAPASIFQQVRKLMPGQCLSIQHKKITPETWYTLPSTPLKTSDLSYADAQKELKERLEKSVSLRMTADVPLGCFLSGGTDSSVIATLAQQQSRQLQTFSVGYADEPYFDETGFASAVAEKIGSRHQVFSLTNDDLFEHLDAVLEYIDEPFADSSAIAVYLLSKKTRNTVTVALSGDGADEIFTGYHKHRAEWRAQQKNRMNSAISAGTPLWKLLPQSRQSKLGNLGRQLNRFATGLSMSTAERYWHWASFLPQDTAQELLFAAVDKEAYEQRKKAILKHLTDQSDLNDILYTDTHLVLPNDMLTKVDLMSMANSLEVRTPYLDHHVTEFAFSLPVAYKTDGKMQKKILQDTFRTALPEKLYKRSKQGFEVPLLKWFRTGLKSRITDDLLHPDLIREQGLFQPEIIENLKKQLFAQSPGDIHLTLWNLIVFQSWWKRYIQAG